MSARRTFAVTVPATVTDGRGKVTEIDERQIVDAINYYFNGRLSGAITVAEVTP